MINKKLPRKSKKSAKKPIKYIKYKKIRTRKNPQDNNDLQKIIYNLFLSYGIVDEIDDISKDITQILRTRIINDRNLIDEQKGLILDQFEFGYTEDLAVDICNYLMSNLVLLEPNIKYKLLQNAYNLNIR